MPLFFREVYDVRRYYNAYKAQILAHNCYHFWQQGGTSQPTHIRTVPTPSSDVENLEERLRLTMLAGGRLPSTTVSSSSWTKLLQFACLPGLPERIMASFSE
jgi:hypothetical protein